MNPYRVRRTILAQKLPRANINKGTQHGGQSNTFDFAKVCKFLFLPHQAAYLQSLLNCIHQQGQFIENSYSGEDTPHLAWVPSLSHVNVILSLVIHRTKLSLGAVIWRWIARNLALRFTPHTTLLPHKVQGNKR